MPPVRLPPRLLSFSATFAWSLNLGLTADSPHGSSAPEPQRLNNLTTLLGDIASPSVGGPHPFVHKRDGWLFFSLATRGDQVVRLTLDKGLPGEAVVHLVSAGDATREAMHWLSNGHHTLHVEAAAPTAVERLTVHAIPELMHCGLGYNPAIKSYGAYDLEFLKRDILPNVTTLIVPHNIRLPESTIKDWRRQGKRFVAEVGIYAPAKTAAEHASYWTSFFEQASFLDGIIINEFIVNRPVSEWVPTMTQERRDRMAKERAEYEMYAETFKKIRADPRFTNKSVYAYVGGSGKKLNQEIIGTNFIRSLIDCGYFVSPERYLHEMSSHQSSEEALQSFVEGLADWELREPGVKKQMVITFGLFSMPPGGLNKLPNVDYHVWMDRQMNVLANHSTLTNIAGLNWWTSLQADEETVRFVGKLYRHYAIEGQTNRLTTDPLFLPHLQNADFEQGTNGWILRPAEPGSIDVKSFPRYGRIEGRFMGLGRPADPERIGDTFLWMKRSTNRPNTFSQIIRDLQPGRLYSLKMFVCDYQDLITPKSKRTDEATTTATILLEGAEVDSARSFAEIYASSPEPKIPVGITYHWKIFRARGTNATLTISDWSDRNSPPTLAGQEQAFNFLEIQPYHE